MTMKEYVIMRRNTVSNPNPKGVRRVIAKVNSFVSETLRGEELSHEARRKRLELMRECHALRRHQSFNRRHYHNSEADGKVKKSASTAELSRSNSRHSVTSPVERKRQQSWDKSRSHTALTLPRGGADEKPRPRSFSASGCLNTRIATHPELEQDLITRGMSETHAITLWKTSLEPWDEAGWLQDQQDDVRKWAILADSLLCFFISEEAKVATQVFYLPAFYLEIDEDDLPLPEFRGRSNPANDQTGNTSFAFVHKISGARYIFGPESRQEFHQWCGVIREIMDRDTDASEYESDCSQCDLSGSDADSCFEESGAGFCMCPTYDCTCPPDGQELPRDLVSCSYRDLTLPRRGERGIDIPPVLQRSVSTDLVQLHRQEYTREYVHGLARQMWPPEGQTMPRDHGVTEGRSSASTTKKSKPTLKESLRGSFSSLHKLVSGKNKEFRPLLLNRPMIAAAPFSDYVEIKQSSKMKRMYCIITVNTLNGFLIPGDIKNSEPDIAVPLRGCRLQEGGIADEDRIYKVRVVKKGSSTLHLSVKDLALYVKLVDVVRRESKRNIEDVLQQYQALKEAPDTSSSQSLGLPTDVLLRLSLLAIPPVSSRGQPDGVVSPTGSYASSGTRRPTTSDYDTQHYDDVKSSSKVSRKLSLRDRLKLKAGSVRSKLRVLVRDSPTGKVTLRQQDPRPAEVLGTMSLSRGSRLLAPRHQHISSIFDRSNSVTDMDQVMEGHRQMTVATPKISKSSSSGAVRKDFRASPPFYDSTVDNSGPSSAASAASPASAKSNNLTIDSDPLLDADSTPSPTSLEDHEDEADNTIVATPQRSTSSPDRRLDLPQPENFFYLETPNQRRPSFNNSLQLDSDLFTQASHEQKGRNDNDVDKVKKSRSTILGRRASREMKLPREDVGRSSTISDVGGKDKDKKRSKAKISSDVRELRLETPVTAAESRSSESRDSLADTASRDLASTDNDLEDFAEDDSLELSIPDETVTSSDRKLKRTSGESASGSGSLANKSGLHKTQSGDSIASELLRILPRQAEIENEYARAQSAEHQRASQEMIRLQQMRASLRFKADHLQRTLKSDRQGSNGRARRKSLFKRGKSDTNLAQLPLSEENNFKTQVRLSRIESQIGDLDKQLATKEQTMVNRLTTLSEGQAKDVQFSSQKEQLLQSLDDLMSIVQPRNGTGTLRKNGTRNGTAAVNGRLPDTEGESPSKSRLRRNGRQHDLSADIHLNIPRAASSVPPSLPLEDGQGHLSFASYPVPAPPPPPQVKPGTSWLSEEELWDAESSIVDLQENRKTTVCSRVMDQIEDFENSFLVSASAPGRTQGGSSS